jgi:uncharacterized Fe-S cluster-containing radical SAM superfamily enzyme
VLPWAYQGTRDRAENRCCVYDILEIVSGIASIPGICEVDYDHQCAHVERESQALKDAGLHRINISMDSTERGYLPRNDRAAI